MNSPITAIYENGVLKPLVPLDLEEHATVSLAIVGRSDQSRDESGAVDDPTTLEALRLVESSGVLDFWNDEAEDGYTEDDGEAI